MNYVVDANTGCWVWQGYKSPLGYGQARFGGVAMNAHRAVYLMRVGPIPEGLVLDHLCRNPSCVNPDHVEPVTQAENVRRGLLTTLTEDEVRAICDEPIPAAEAAAHFGISAASVFKIRSGIRWRLADFEPRPHGYYTPRDPRLDEIIRLYRDGYSLERIGREFGCTGPAVGQRLRNAGVPRRAQRASRKRVYVEQDRAAA